MLKNLCFDNVSIIIHFMYKQCVFVCVCFLYISYEGSPEKQNQHKIDDDDR